MRHVYTIPKTHFTHLHTTTGFLTHGLPMKISSAFSYVFLVSVFNFLLKIFAFFLPCFFFRSRGNHSHRNESHVTDEPLSKGVDWNQSFELQKSDDDDDDDDGAVADTGDSVFLTANNTSKYEFISGGNVIQYLEKPKGVKVMVQEMFVGRNGGLDSCDRNLDCEIERKFSKESDEILVGVDEDMYSSDEYLECEELENNSDESDEESSSFRNEDIQVDRESIPSDQGRIGQASSIIAWNWDSFSLSEEDRWTFQREDIVIDQERGCNSLGSRSTEFDEQATQSVDGEVLEDQDVSYEVELLSPGRYLEPEVEEQDVFGSNQSCESSDQDGIDFHEMNDKREPGSSNIDHTSLNTWSEGIEDLDDEYIELEPSKVHPDLGTEATRNYTKNEEKCNEGNASVEVLQSSASDSDDEDESTDALREHQNLVHQMKMELKACRIKGLPTISEECETPKMVEDLKPLNIDHKFDYKDKMADIQKFYKSYAEKMRKLDILNYQTLHAISFLQLKESEVFTAGKKKSASGNFNMSKIWSYKVQKIYADPMQKSIKEMQHDLELVYVGQLCLSWEILSWMCVKCQELMEYDTGEHHSYNRASEEFQQFQVLLHRFIEDERFQGPRVQNYVKNRCLIRSLLQVPVVKDDCLKDKKERKEEKDTISLAAILEILRESMLVFREFVCADKASANVFLKGLQGTKPVLLDNADSELLAEIMKVLQKKERKLGEQVKSQNCIMKKFAKHPEPRLSHELSATQVELRLVARVLTLSRLTTDQLIWCQNKLSNISFVRRKVHLEPSFLLFPC